MVSPARRCGGASRGPAPPRLWRCAAHRLFLRVALPSPPHDHALATGAAPPALSRPGFPHTRGLSGAEPRQAFLPFPQLLRPRPPACATCPPSPRVPPPPSSEHRRLRPHHRRSPIPRLRLALAPPRGAHGTPTPPGDVGGATATAMEVAPGEPSELHCRSCIGAADSQSGKASPPPLDGRAVAPRSPAPHAVHCPVLASVVPRRCTKPRLLRAPGAIFSSASPAPACAASVTRAAWAQRSGMD
ncbi:hypothetical protein U9M48_025206 [Paspalum notatum var. saurae]|uniref:Uncharacterized protein n=1 Tax=Paspalum notatum var. saurae TaxID=547442 RepID=A0AAQ3TQ18_PASNO